MPNPVDNEVIEGLADGQHYLEISTTAPAEGATTTYVRVPLVLDIDMPEPKRVTHDITPTDATNTYKVAVNFFETSDINFEMVFNPDNTEHAAIKEAYNKNKSVYCRILFEDTRVQGYEFMGSLTSFMPDPNPKEKLKYKGTVVISGPIKDDVTAEDTPSV